MLTRNLDAYLALMADILVRPTFSGRRAGSHAPRGRSAQIDELRNDDRALAGRFFARNLYADHPYGHPPDGIAAALEAARPDEVSAHFRRHFVGKNLVFAFAGDVEPDALGRRAEARVPRPVRRGRRRSRTRWSCASRSRRRAGASSWSTSPIGSRRSCCSATRPCARPIRTSCRSRSALTAFGGHAMNSTMMSEIRTQARPRLRRLPDAGPAPRRGAGDRLGVLGQRQDGHDVEAGAEALRRVHGQGPLRGGRGVLQALPDRVARVGHGRARAAAGRPRDRGGRRPARGLRRHLSRDASTRSRPPP